jgi:hypothetical protein
MNSDVLMRVVDCRLRYKVLLEERIRQLEAVLEKAPASVNYVRIAGEVKTYGGESGTTGNTLAGCFAGRWGAYRLRGEPTTRSMSPRDTRADDDE